MMGVVIFLLVFSVFLIMHCYVLYGRIDDLKREFVISCADNHRILEIYEYQLDLFVSAMKLSTYDERFKLVKDGLEKSAPRINEIKNIYSLKRKIHE